MEVSERSYLLEEVQMYVEGLGLDLDPLDPDHPPEIFSISARTPAEQVVQYYLLIYYMFPRWQQEVLLVFPFQVAPFQGTPLPIILPHDLFEDSFSSGKRAAEYWADRNGCDPGTVTEVALDLH